jgi:hypothetical protein
MEGWVCDQERSAYPLVDPGERASGRKLGVVQIRRRIGDEPLTILCRSTRKHRREFHDGPTNPDRQLVPIDWRISAAHEGGSTAGLAICARKHGSRP